jgi:C4-dicarboxylate-specific signal transduction histidine kinase
LGFLKRQPIRRQVVAATCVLLVPFALAVAWSEHQTRREQEREVLEQAGSVAVTSAAYLNQYLTGIDSMASALAVNPAVRALDREQTDQIFADVLHDQRLLLNVVLTDRNGLLKGTGIPARANLGQTVTLDYFKEVVKTGRPLVSQLTTGVATGKPTVVLAYPVRGQGSDVAGVIGIGLDLSRLQTLFNSIPLPEGSVITLTDSSSRVLARSREAERYIGTVVAEAASRPSDVPIAQVLTGIDGVERYFGNAVVERGPWVLSVGIPTNIVTARITPLWRRNLLIAVATIGCFLGVALWGSNLLSRGLNQLRASVQRIADGDLSPPARRPAANLEIAQLQDGFITMAANLREAREALAHQVEQERKTREMLQSLQRQVVRQERLAAVGILVSGVAHELNNPLQAILGTIELLEQRPTLDPETREEIGFIKTQSGRAREIIRNLSRFSSQQAGTPTIVELRDVISEVIQLRRRDLDAASISLEVEASTTRKVHASFTELAQVILNFVINAQQSIDASGRKGGRILIRLFDTAKKLRLEVHDDGPGVATEDEPKLFQPFFTTKPVGKGTGLGLSVSYGIIESYGGAIGYMRSKWGGATFFFELPGVDPATLPQQPPAAASESDDRSSLLQQPISRRV